MLAIEGIDGAESLTIVAHKPNIEVEQAPFNLIRTLFRFSNQVSLTENDLLFVCSEEKPESRHHGSAGVRVASETRSIENQCVALIANDKWENGEPAYL